MELELRVISISNWIMMSRNLTNGMDAEREFRQLQNKLWDCTITQTWIG